MQKLKMLLISWAVRIRVGMISLTHAMIMLVYNTLTAAHINRTFVVLVRFRG